MRAEDFRWDEARVGLKQATKADCSAARKSHVAAKPYDKFLKGPLPWSWLERASKLPGKATLVGLCLWRLVGLRGDRTVWLANDEVVTLCVDRYAKSRALKALKEAGLIDLEHRKGRIPRVTVLDT